MIGKLLNEADQNRRLECECENLKNILYLILTFYGEARQHSLIAVFIIYKTYTSGKQKMTINLVTVDFK